MAATTAILQHLDAVKTFLEGSSGASGFATMSNLQVDSVLAKLEHIRLDAASVAPLTVAITAVPWAAGHRDRLLEVVGSKFMEASAERDASVKAPQPTIGKWQDYRSFITYLTDRQWETLRSQEVDPIEYITGLLKGLGLHTPGETTSQLVTAICMLASEDINKLRALFPSALRPVYNSVKSKLKSKYSGGIQINPLPNRPSELKDMYPEIYDGFYGSDVPGRCPFTQMDIDMLCTKHKIKCRGPLQRSSFVPTLDMSNNGAGLGATIETVTSTLLQGMQDMQRQNMRGGGLMGGAPQYAACGTGAPQLAALSGPVQKLVEDVKQFGRIPIQTRGTSAEEKAEYRLAQRLKFHRDSIPNDVLQELRALGKGRAKPCVIHESTRKQFQCRAGIKGKGRKCFSIKYTDQASKTKAKEEAERWLCKELKKYVWRGKKLSVGCTRS